MNVMDSAKPASGEKDRIPVNGFALFSQKLAPLDAQAQYGRYSANLCRCRRPCA